MKIFSICAEISICCLFSNLSVKLMCTLDLFLFPLSKGILDFKEKENTKSLFL